MYKRFYKVSIWLNSNESPSIGSVVAYDGMCTDNGDKYRNTFLSISDCFNTVRLHKIEDDSMDEFIGKMETLKDTISDFIDHLKKNKDIL